MTDAVREAFNATLWPLLVAPGDVSCDNAWDALTAAGLAIVPAEPTEAMLDAAKGHMVATNDHEQYLIDCQRRDDAGTWRAMITAAGDRHE